MTEKNDRTGEVVNGVKIYAYKKAKLLYIKEQLTEYKKEVGDIIFENLINYSINH